jgi:hypothetical protein
MHMQKLRTACKEAAWVFGMSRLLIILVTLVSNFLLPQIVTPYRQFLIAAATSSSPYKYAPFSFSTLFYSWLRWDAKPYLNISFAGYKYTPDAAFFPLWPLIQHFGGLLLGGFFPASYYLAGMLLSNICFFVVLVLLYYLVAGDFEPATARRTLLYFTIAPYALFFFADYTESLFVLLCVACFLVLRRGKALDWWLAGLFGFLAALTRSSGMLLAIPYLVVYTQRFWLLSQRGQYNWRQKLNALLPIALIPAGLLVYMLYLYFTKGNPFIFSIEQEVVWGRHFTLPWDTFFVSIEAFFQETAPIFIVGNLIYLIASIVPFVVLSLGWKRLPLHYSLFALALPIFALSFPMYIPQFEPLSSQPRFMLVIFPLTVILALWGKNPRFNKGYLSFALTLFIINIILFIGNIWVA